MKCMDCKGEMKESTTTYFVDLKNCMIIVKNVPCLECEQCGETYFTDAVARRLDEIVEDANSRMTQLAIMEYSGAAA